MFAYVFHVKPLTHKRHPSYHKPVNFRRSAGIALALLLLPLLSSCVSVLNPTGWAPVVFEGDTAYVVTSKGRLTSVTLDGDSGQANWTFPDPDRDDDDEFKTRAIYGAPVLDGDRIYVASFEGGVFGLNKADGRPVWPTSGPNEGEIEGNIAGGLALAGDTLFFGTTEGRLYAWNKADGKPAPGWDEPKSFDGGIWATPVVDGDTVYVATMKGKIHALSVADGSPRWQEPFETTAAIAELAAAAEGVLFVPSINRHAYLVSMDDGTELADFPADDWLWTAPAVDESRVYFGDFGGSVYALDITNDSLNLAWSSDELARIRSGPVVIDDVLVVADRSPAVWFFNAEDGRQLGLTVPIPDAGTIRANLVEHEGNAYFATTNGKLFRAEPQNQRVVEINLSGVKK